MWPIGRADSRACAADRSSAIKRCDKLPGPGASSRGAGVLAPDRMEPGGRASHWSASADLRPLKRTCRPAKENPARGGRGQKKVSDSLPGLRTAGAPWSAPGTAHFRIGSPPRRQI